MVNFGDSMNDQNDPFIVGDWLVEREAGELSNGGQRIHLEPKAMEVLCYLASRPGEVVSREDLERDVWKGAIVGYDSVGVAITKLRRAFGDEAANPAYIATVPKRGYRLIANVTEPSGSISETLTPPVSGIAGSKRGNLLKVGMILGLLLFGLLLAQAFLQMKRIDDSPPYSEVAHAKEVRSILVTPFTNLSDDPRQQPLADGMTDDIITDLARVSNLEVTASSVSFGLNKDRIDPMLLGQELGVDLVLAGTIQRSGDRIRLNVQLVDTKTGFQKWAERYDKHLDDLFAMQDELTKQLVEALAIRLTSQEQARLAHAATSSFRAYELFLEGQRNSFVNSKQASEQAKNLYQKAIKLDPSYGRAYGALGFLEARSYTRGWTDTPQASRDRALELAMRGVALDDSVPQTYWALGYVHVMRKEFEKAREAALRAIEIAPNYGDGYGLLALIYNHLGQSEKAVEMVTRGMRINPHYTWDYLYNLGRAYYFLGRFTEAAESLEAAAVRNENAMSNRVFLAATYVRLNRLDDAEWEIEQARMNAPSLSISLIENRFPISHQAQKAMFIEDLRAAGLSE